VKKIGLFTMAAATIALSASIYAFNAPKNAASINATAAYAETQVYPENFKNTLTFSSLTDYAVNGDNYAFAEGTSLSILTVSSDDSTLTTYDCGFEIKRLEYEGDNLYLSDAEQNSYLYSGSTSKVSYTFQEKQTRVEVDGYLYFFGNGSLCWLNDQGDMDTFGEGYTNLKLCGDKAYIVKDNVLYNLNANQVTPVSLEYTDFSAASTIEIGDIAAKLKGNYSTSTVTVESGAYCTQIDLDEVGGTYFKAIKTVRLSGVKSALLLTNIGNASIIIMNDGDECNSYITLTSSLTPTAYKTAECDITKAYTLMQTGIYSAPFISEATKIASLPQAAELEVTAKFSLTFMDFDYYQVSYTDADGQKVSGYVAANLLSQYSFSSEQGEDEVIKGDFDYTNVTEKVILVLLIVCLVIVAIAFLTITGTRNSKRSKKSKNPSRTITRSNQQTNNVNSEGVQSTNPYPDYSDPYTLNDSH
jgi:cell division protein FtsL